jgi:hypothetical protein
MAMKYLNIPPGMKAYTLDICEAPKGDHDLRPGFATLKAGEHELGLLVASVPATKRSRRAELVLDAPPLIQFFCVALAFIFPTLGDGLRAVRAPIKAWEWLAISQKWKAHYGDGRTSAKSRSPLSDDDGQSPPSGPTGDPGVSQGLRDVHRRHRRSGDDIVQGVRGPESPRAFEGAQQPRLQKNETTASLECTFLESGRLLRYPTFYVPS